VVGPGRMMTNSSLVVLVPSKLFVSKANFPISMQSLAPLGNKKCERDLHFQLAVAWAGEVKKGGSSFYAPYFRVLPTMAEFRSFHPITAKPSLLRDFQPLPVMEIVRSVQARDMALASCFQAWQRMPGADLHLARLTWEDVYTALLQLRTRSHGINEVDAAMVPGADMLNVGMSSAGLDGTGSLNTEWNISDGWFAVKTNAPVAAGQELSERYCDECGNDLLLPVWGIFLEHNPHPLAHQKESEVRCHAKLPWQEQPRASYKTLREATEAALDIPTGATQQRNRTMRAPRCKASAMASEQGPLRCSLARYAWEYCHLQWASTHIRISEVHRQKSSRLLQSLTSFNGLDAETMAEAVSNTVIQRVDPRLLQHNM